MQTEWFDGKKFIMSFFSMREVFLLLLIILFTSFSLSGFKEEQLRYTRVRKAYSDKEEYVLKKLNEKAIGIGNLQIYIRAFKAEKKLELWGKNSNESTFKLIKEYDVCMMSGVLGPKRKQGDLQVPEGYYHINRFNPYSNFYLSMGINYPNKSDRLLGVKGNLGGDIFIHGDCVTIGCLPITDDKIKELYVFCVEARNNGQKRIPVSIFPARLTDTKYKQLVNRRSAGKDKVNLWTDLKSGYDYFNEQKKLPAIVFLEDGRRINP